MEPIKSGSIGILAETHMQIHARGVIATEKYVYRELLLFPTYRGTFPRACTFPRFNYQD